MQKTKLNRLAALLLSAGLLFIAPLCFSRTAEAAADKRITLTCTQDEIILKGVQWELFQIGERQDHTVNFIPALSEYELDLGDLSTEAVDTAAKTLESYVTAAGLAPIAAGSTDSNGELVFEGLDNGLYLAVGKPLQIGSICYYPSALLLEILGSDTGMSYDAFPKFYAEHRSNADKAYIVRKVWVDDDDANHARPVNITVDLFENGVLRETVTLDESNNWEYRWETLDTASRWTVVERKIPAHYEVMIDYNSQQYLIRNTYQDTPKVTTAPPAVTTTATTTAEVKKPAKLIQTGQLWWPVLPLSVGGLLLIGIGISARTGKKDNEE